MTSQKGYVHFVLGVVALFILTSCFFLFRLNSKNQIQSATETAITETSGAPTASPQSPKPTSSPQVHPSGIPLGPQTEAFFNKVLENKLQVNASSSSIQTSTSFVQICDLNSDSKCDDSDKAIFEKSLGSCRLKGNDYNPITDGDADGCVTETDFKILFKAN